MFAEREGVRAQGVEALRYRQGLLKWRTGSTRSWCCWGSLIALNSILLLQLSLTGTMLWLKCTLLVHCSTFIFKGLVI